MGWKSPFTVSGCVVNWPFAPPRHSESPPGPPRYHTRSAGRPTSAGPACRGAAGPPCEAAAVAAPTARRASPPSAPMSRVSRVPTGRLLPIGRWLRPAPRGRPGGAEAGVVRTDAVGGEGPVDPGLALGVAGPGQRGALEIGGVAAEQARHLGPRAAAALAEGAGAPGVEQHEVGGPAHA